MSIYSGFATRNQQQTYDQLVFNLIQLLSRKILKTYKNESADQLKFTQIIKEIFMKLSLLQKQKYLQPNISNALYDIMEHYLEQQKQQNNQLLSQRPKLWIKVQKKSDQNLTDDTRKNEKAQLQPRKTTSNLNHRIKTPMINPEGSYTQRNCVKNKQQGVGLANKFKIQKNEGERQKQRGKKYKSLRRFDQNEQIKTIQREQIVESKNICPHCHEQKFSRKSNNKQLIRKQRCQSLQKVQKRRSGIIIPELVKEYIEATNHDYMRHFRKRKVKYGLV